MDRDNIRPGGCMPIRRWKSPRTPDQIHDNMVVVIELVRDICIANVGLDDRPTGEFENYQKGHIIEVDGADARPMIEAGNARLYVDKRHCIDVRTKEVFAVAVDSFGMLGVAGPFCVEDAPLLENCQYEPDLIDYIVENREHLGDIKIIYEPE